MSEKTITTVASLNSVPLYQLSDTEFHHESQNFVEPTHKTVVLNAVSGTLSITHQFIEMAQTCTVRYNHAQV